jgi:thiol:disulfide interchange protein
VCVPLLISRYRQVVYFGILNLAAAVFLAWTFRSGFTSIWCAWAAVASAAIALHIRYTAAHRPPPRPPRRAAPQTTGV